MVSFSITIAGWWVWNIFLSLAYDPDNRWPYNVRGGFIKRFGQDPTWWLTLILTVLIIALGDLAPFIYRESMRSSIARRLGLGAIPYISKIWPPMTEETDIARWQELERDPEVAQRLREMANGGTNSVPSTWDD